MEDLKSLIDSCIEDNQYAAGRSAVKEETWAYPQEGAVRAADYLLKKYEELTQKQEEQ
jgi:predicted transglutaminase-like cysteine proteinase